MDVESYHYLYVKSVLRLMHCLHASTRAMLKAILKRHFQNYEYI